jgi:hypothetical protein
MPYSLWQITMDMKDIDSEMGDIKMPQVRPRKRLDMSVPQANLKAAACKAIAALFIMAVAVFGMYSVVNAKGAGIDVRVLAAVTLVYFIISAFVSFKLWNLDFGGWLIMVLISLSGIVLPAMSAASHGIMVGTIPIIVASVILLIAMIWCRDLYRIKNVGDIFKPY